MGSSRSKMASRKAVNRKKKKRSPKQVLAAYSSEWPSEFNYTGSELMSKHGVKR